jgi:hypothetical protein
MFTQQERELLIKVISEVRIAPLSADAIPLLTLLQSAAQKIASSQLSESVDTESLDRKRKGRKTDDEFTA